MNISPQLMTITSTLHLHHLLKKCSTLKQLNQIHSYFITTGILQVDPRLLGRLFFFSATTDSADIHYASLLFSQLHHPNIFFYNTMIKAHSRTTSPQNSISIYTQILRSGLLPDIYTYPLLLKACTQQVPFFPQGRSVHGQAIKFALDSYIYVNNSLIHFYSVNEQINSARKLFDTCNDLDIVSWNSMISAYVRAHSIDNAKNLFDQMPERNSISWSALISGYVQCGLSREALGVFERMQVELVKINEITLVSVLSACAHLGALEQGKWVHGYLKSNKIEVSVFLGTSLIDMYAKCGEVELALEVFNAMKERNLLAWTTMIKGLAMHGRGQDALDLFLNMEKTGIKPDDITFIGVLCACTHAGLIDQGCQIFNTMSSDYGIEPKIEHYGCMVDLLARGGKLMEARLMVESMPIKPDALIWGALMAGCRFYRNVELAEFVVKRLIQLEPYNGGIYVLLSNIYAASGRQEDAKKVRGLMEMKGALKIAGCSSIEIGGTLHQFIVGDTSHPQIRKILVKWEEIERFLNLEGYVPNKTEVLLDIDEEDKEEALARHSEKLAIAFGLASTEDGVPIRIVKNLRVCSDCHLVTKLISRIYNREIIVRDRTRFHLFKDGKCSCKDYWFLAFRNTRKAANLFLANQKTRYSEVNWHGGILTAGLPPSIYKFSGRRQVTLALYSAKQKEIMCRCTKSFSVLSASKTMTHHAQVAWKRLFQICSYSVPAYPPISRIACAVSLALTRSNLVAPSIIGFIIGEVAWTQTTWADAGNFSTRDTRYMDIEERRLCLISFLFSIAEVFILFLRAVYLTIIFSPTVAMAPFADCLGVQFRKTWLQLVHLTLEQAGPAFIKWGQWAATRPDLFPNDLCTELTKLHSNAPTHSFAHTKRTIEKAFGRTLSELFESFEETPLASGSVAQVHRATLRFRYPGKKTKSVEVAVKVRHPGVGEAIRRDFVLIDFAAKISKFIPTLKWLRLDESVQQFAVFMMSQVDLAREAAHLNRFIHNFRRWKDVSFPEPLYPLVHPAVLVETYEHGESVSHFVDELEGNDRIKSALAHIGTHALLKMLLVDNFIHADMHPGNILVRVGQSKSARNQFKSKPHVVFLDVGMTAELSKSDRVNILELFKAVVLRDGRTAAECTLRLSKQQKCPNPKAFIEEVGETFSFWGTTDGGGIHPADCMQQLLEKVRRHRVNIDGNVCTVMVTTLVLESWQRKLDPDYDVMDTLKTLLFRADWAETLSYTIEGLMAP